jgi:hypothetical protein
MTGAEFAPSIVVGYVTERGGFYATLDAVPMITRHNNERVKAPYVEAVRQLSCDDPDDMRAIWRLAALTLGATEEEALHTDFHRLDLALINASDPWGVWRLDVREWCALRTIAQLDLMGCDDAHATAALCAHVWGSK